MNEPRTEQTGAIERTEDTHQQPQETHHLLLRVSTFGAFQLAWQVPISPRQETWNSRTSARTLFKLLLCAPGRQATRSVLAGILWPDTDEEKARESLRSAYKVLRKVLRTAQGEELIELRNNGDILVLADQTRLWVDADAFEGLVAQASRASSSDTALALWEEAQALLRGEFLADDQGAEWTSHPIVKRRRQALWMARCRVIRHLADLYVQRGHISLAEETLEQHLVRFPTDQDALHRLLLLLEQQGSFEQASILYERARRTLEAVGKQPATHVRVLYERFQQTITSGTYALPAQTERPSPSTRLPVAIQTALALSQANLSDTASLPETGISPDITLAALRALIQPEEEETSDMPQLSRRQLLELGIAALISHLARLDKKRITAIDREELGWALGKGIADGWKLFLSTANAEILAVSELQLTLLHQVHPLLYPSTRSYLYTGAYELMGLVLHFQNRYEEALHHYHNAYLAAIATGDPIYVARNLICQADTHLTMGHYTEAIQALEESLSYLGDTDEEHRRARAHLLGVWADVAMTMQEYNLAQKKLEESAYYLDKTTIIEEFDRTSWLQLAGKKAVMAGDYEQAATYLEEALNANPPHWIARHVGILIPLAIAYARMREREHSLLIAQQTIPVLGAMNAPMTNKYFLEYLRNDIAGRFPRDSKIQRFLTETQQQLPHLPIGV